MDKEQSRILNKYCSLNSHLFEGINCEKKKNELKNALYNSTGFAGFAVEYSFKRFVKKVIQYTYINYLLMKKIW